ncbi:DUF6188 family protein [Streptacidiphilus rugosus]|uniref:DUF6188 family protein n=1 Tax=Streptacidiphilus rugosus TaxID=405783 RepID=UPI0012FA1ACF|nr:DUF6188 family protein [Streptacidiphilus rugosus]
MSQLTVLENDDRWILGLRNTRISAVRRGEVTTIELGADGWIKVGNSAVVSVGAVTAPRARTESLAAVSEEILEDITRSRILSAVAFKSGALRLVFDSGIHLNSRAAGRGSTVEISFPGVFSWSCEGNSSAG